MMGKALEESRNRLLVRSSERQASIGEVFTPTPLVLEILEKLPESVWEEGKTYLDPACGNGQFLAAVLIEKLSLGHKKSLSTIYGVDLMGDNVEECRGRLFDIMWDEGFFPGVKTLSPAYKAARTKALKKILEQNIVCADGLTYDYSFNGVVKKKPEQLTLFR